MFSKTELLSLLIAALVVGYVAAFKQITWLEWLKWAGLGLTVIVIHVLATKAVAAKLDCSLEYRLWTIRQYGFKRKSYFKRPFPTWLVIPLAVVWLTVGVVKWLAVLVFDATPRRERVTKRFTEITEWELALIAAAGPYASIALAIISALAGWPELASLSVWFAFFSLLPISELAGAKIFFGGKIFWLSSFSFALIILILLGIASLVTTLIAAVLFAFMVAALFYALVEARRR